MTVEIRPARPEDADHLTRFVNMAGEGMALYLWQKNAPEGTDPWDYGRQRACDPEVGFNWRNTDVAVVDGDIAGSVAHYPLPDAPQPIGDDLPAMFVPLIELENLACGTRYVNVLAVYDQYRGQGIGRRLMQQVESCTDGRDLSLIVENANSVARGLYESMGFELQATRDIVDGGWGPSGDQFCLMTRVRAR